MMIPSGYLAKKVEARPDWLKAPSVSDVFSVSACVSGYFVDYIPLMRHNDFWLFNSICDVEQTARDQAVDIAGMLMFYYEVFEKQYDAKTRKWTVFSLPKFFSTNVEVPSANQFVGFDVVTFFGGTNPESSPLSCNGLAETISVNRHCLFDTFEASTRALEQGEFARGEQGPFRIFAVYTVQA